MLPAWELRTWNVLPSEEYSKGLSAKRPQLIWADFMVVQRDFMNMRRKTELFRVSVCEYTMPDTVLIGRAVVYIYKIGIDESHL